MDNQGTPVFRNWRRPAPGRCGESVNPDCKPRFYESFAFQRMGRHSLKSAFGNVPARETAPKCKHRDSGNPMPFGGADSRSASWTRPIRCWWRLLVVVLSSRIARGGQKIEAIRLYRMQAGVGLKDAKQFIDERIGGRATNKVAVRASENSLTRSASEGSVM